jgi:hypothetical protein
VWDFGCRDAVNRVSTSKVPHCFKLLIASGSRAILT